MHGIGYAMPLRVMLFRDVVAADGMPAICCRRADADATARYAAARMNTPERSVRSVNRVASDSMPLFFIDASRLRHTRHAADAAAVMICRAAFS